MTAPLKPLRWYRDLASKEGRIEAGVFTVEGGKAIRQVMAARPGEITGIVSVRELPPEFQDYPLRIVTEKQFEYISHTRTPQGILALVRIPENIFSDRLPEIPGERVLLLEDIQDPGNTGTLIRTAAAFNFSGVILTEDGADPLSPKCVQAASGALLSLWLRRTPKYPVLVESLKAEGFTLIAADLRGTSDPSVLRGLNKLLLALGNEATGLSGPLLDMADYRIRIPVAPDKAESLNVAASGAILMYLASGL